VDFDPLEERNGFRIVASAKTTGPTGVEMEALTAASVAALTVYDMVKAVDKGAVIESVRLLTKSGGKSGSYKAPARSVPEVEPEPEMPHKPVVRKSTPQVLIHEVAAPKLGSPSTDRDALRKFMTTNRLRPLEWAKSASIPVNELYGFLSGRSSRLPQASAEKLAKAARTSVDAMFGRSSRR
jgi:hypothetical protein